MAAGTWESHHAISNLMFCYAECVDQADFDGLSKLFAQGEIRFEDVVSASGSPDRAGR